MIPNRPSSPTRWFARLDWWIVAVGAVLAGGCSVAVATLLGRRRADWVPLLLVLGCAVALLLAGRRHLLAWTRTRTTTAILGVLLALGLAAGALLLPVGSEPDFEWLLSSGGGEDRPLSMEPRSSWGETRSGIELHAGVDPHDPSDPWPWRAKTAVAAPAGCYRFSVTQPEWAVIDRARPRVGDGVTVVFRSSRSAATAELASLFLHAHLEPSARRWHRVDLVAPSTAPLTIEALAGSAGSHNWNDRLYVAPVRFLPWASQAAPILLRVANGLAAAFVVLLLAALFGRSVESSGGGGVAGWLRRLRSFTCGLIVAACTLVACSFSLFLLFESFPGLLRVVDLTAIDYYSIRQRYVPDRGLVFVYRPAGPPSTFRSPGDLYRPAYGVAPQWVETRSTYTSTGFRSNRSQPPFDVIAIGDSYLEIGNDTETFAERLRDATGYRVMNLGRAWYGPHQYVEVLRRWGLAQNARHVLLCVFGGNDVDDTAEYDRWRREGRYYFFRDLERVPLLERYWLTVAGAASATRQRAHLLWQTWASRRAAATPHPELGVIEIGAREIPMAFRYWNRPVAAEKLRQSAEWRAITAILRQFRDMCREHDITPWIVYIPTKLEVYGRYASPESGSRFRSRLPDQLRFEDNTSTALATTVEQLSIRFVDLTPCFRELARRDALLYHPFDTHWNAEGRRAAAETLARALDGPTPESTSDGDVPHRAVGRVEATDVCDPPPAPSPSAVPGRSQLPADQDSAAAAGENVRDLR